MALSRCERHQKQFLLVQTSVSASSQGFPGPDGPKVLNCLSNRSNIFKKCQLCQNQANGVDLNYPKK